MFVHAPEKPETTITALVLWDDPDLAFQAVEMCRAIEGRSEELKFQIEEADVADLEVKAEELGAKACKADLVMIALHRSLQERTEMVKNWFVTWSHARDRQAGALAVLRPPDHVDPEQFRHLVHEMRSSLPSGPEEENQLRHFLENCATQARMEFFWGCLEAELEEATRGMRILEAA